MPTILGGMSSDCRAGDGGGSEGAYTNYRPPARSRITWDGCSRGFLQLWDQFGEGEALLVRGGTHAIGRSARFARGALFGLDPAGRALRYAVKVINLMFETSLRNPLFVFANIKMR